MITSTFLLAVATLMQLGDVVGHGTPHGRSMHPKEISRRQLEANRRHVVARNCAPQIAEFQRKRKLARRNLQRRQDTTASGTDSALQPHTTGITNMTCVTAPEVTEGPYYLNNDMIRQDLRESQGGILLSLDIGVLDTSTCEPLPSALVELWHCNATGSYSGFTTASLDAPDGNGGGQPSDTVSMDLSMSAPDASGSAGPAPSGGGGGGGGGGGSSSRTDSTNFLRGGFETNANGIVTFNTVYPGFYTGRTVHIHTMVHQNVTYNSNGTFVSRSGSLVHIGQMFFEDELNDQVMALEPYSTTTQSRMYNDADSILAEENANGYNAFVDTELIGSDISEGVLGYITLTVDSTAEYQVTSFNYFEGSDAPVPGSDTVTGTGTATDSSSTGTSGAAGRFSSLSSLVAMGKILRSFVEL